MISDTTFISSRQTGPLVAHRWLRRTLAVAVGMALASGSFAAQPTWTPPGTVHLVVPYAPGGGTDVLARMVANQIGSSLGQPLIVENRPGVNGILGANYVFAAPPNGTTLLFAAADFISVSPHIYKKVIKFDPNGFKPVALVGKMGFVLASRSSNEVKNVAEFITQAKSREISYAHWGPGSMAQMGMELLRTKVEGTKALPVPYAGAAPVMAAVMAGDVEYGFVPTPLAMGSRSKIKLLASGSPERFAGLSDVPTLAELGYKVDADTWFGVLAPPNTPQPVIDALQAQVDKVVKDPAFRARLAEIGYTPSNIEPAAFGAFVHAENTRWGAVVKAANITVDE
ncbi:Argininosuccinate lyase [Variovorax sp. PBS-H4]|uniref:Bug family tripartite tricarboxylate transporter substrate binding protein n=1 Tax=Variovorax sp. PBS-H4 TaxID=434008 RepID=UPI00131999C6|nr:tripartite tricarboxylate transporter substrate binding protein [Variovorax sp. PBS-H4]VTU34442.1 Argininosuccinate lyase [Variovorax sp. PBS-H4]